MCMDDVEEEPHHDSQPRKPCGGAVKLWGEGDCCEDSVQWGFGREWMSNHPGWMFGAALSLPLINAP